MLAAIFADDVIDYTRLMEVDEAGMLARLTVVCLLLRGSEHADL
jgi:class 3 adenylate cyclase